ncbi:MULTISPECIES: magnesium transporter [Sphingomonas]|jgi:magnesium transporter|uniref:magnesium transporter n=1 Tax=Sphingomonas TaxID=13687 RepID=UPI0004DF2BDA|nr:MULTISPECIES: magnesium transporter [Sphingomonas]KQM92493.1 magnesium transporter [Sphingomonas sp. Leaf226]KQN21652.1 magnesium transporter [Sphingomonas sp. Leaf30]MBD8469761.1 magnesium transporter [Sphingomonas sp. CFBP 8765]MBD8551278.1 magnesium transporter [Sphingomonas sp. CFBP 8764]MBD8639978.1 magnesium transporter [Sphingomonas sp. CFBP 13733]
MSELELPEVETETQPETQLDRDDRLRPEFVRAVLDAVEDGDNAAARALVEPLHPADIADLFELTPQEDRAALARAVTDLLDGDVFAEMNDYVREDLIDALEPHQVADLASELDTDDAVAIIEDMDEDEQRAVLRALDPDDRAAIEEALSYPEESAGRLMQRELIAVPEHWTVGDAIDYLRGHEELTTDFWEIFVVDPAHKPIGTCQLSWMLRTPRGIAMADVMKREQTLIPVDMDQEEVALRFQKYALISAAVVDHGGRLVGMITVDDIVHIISEEAGEDTLRLAGAGDGDINEPIRLTVRTRFTWLVVNLGTAMVASSVVGLFQGTIASFALLAVLMPIVSGMGGNAGTQTLAVVVRALATNQLTSSNTKRMIVREFRIATANGVMLGTLIGLGTYVIFRNTDLSIVIAAAMLTNNITAGLSGVLVPITLDKFRIDPAVSSAVFVTTMTDTMGFFSFLGLASLWGLHG